MELFCISAALFFFFSFWFAVAVCTSAARAERMMKDVQDT